MSNNRKISLLVFLLTILPLPALAVEAGAGDNIISQTVWERSFSYEAAEINAGISTPFATTTDPTLNISLQIPGGKLNSATQISFDELLASSYPVGQILDENKKEVKRDLYSPVFEFNLATDEVASTSPVLIFQRQRIDAIPTTSQFDLNDGTAPGATNMQRLIIHYFDQTLGTWLPLRTTRDLKNDTWSAAAPTRSGMFALLGVPNEFEAFVSWYPDSLTPSSKWNCASNKFPIGSKIEVCRLDKTEKCVTIKVVSRGPYVDNRIVDLTHSAFLALGSSVSGIFQVQARLAPANSKNIGPNSSNLLASAEFSRNLSYGLKNNSDVKRLQEFLIAKGYLEKESNTGNYFGLTRDAIKKFQKDHKITPINGQFGSKTRGAVNREIQ